MNIPPYTTPNYSDKSLPLATLSREKARQIWVSKFSKYMNTKIVTNSEQYRDDGLSEDFFISDITLKDWGGDMSKPWYVEFYLFIDGCKKHRHRIKAGINRCKKKENRYAMAKSIMTQLRRTMTMTELELNGNGKELNLPNIEEVQIRSESIVKLLYEHVEAIRPTLKKRSYSTYISIIKNFHNYIGEKGIDQLTKKDGTGYLAYLSSKKYATRSIHNNITRLRQLIAELDIVDINPFSGIKLSRRVTGDKNIPWTNQELQHLIEFTKDKLNLQVYWGLIHYCAIRPNEMSYLMRTHFDLTNLLVTIPREASKSNRTQAVSIPRQFLNTIAAYLDIVPDNYYLFSRNLKTGSHRYSGSHLSGFWKECVKDKDSRLSKNAYQLKHTAAVSMYKSGISVEKISKHFRHANTKVTEDYLASLSGYTFTEMADIFPQFDF